MTAASDDQLGFAPDDDAPIPYMARTRDYYAAIGYTTPYRWAHYVDAPFQPLKKPLAQSRVALSPRRRRSIPPRAIRARAPSTMAAPSSYPVYDGDTSQEHDLRISHIAYDRVHTSADDSGTWFPLPQLRRLARAERIGEVAPASSARRPIRSHRVTYRRPTAPRSSSKIRRCCRTRSICSFRRRTARFARRWSGLTPTRPV